MRAAYAAVALGVVCLLVGAYMVDPGVALMIVGAGVAGWGLLVDRAGGGR